MEWRMKHDIMLRWIDSCRTLEQLQNLIPFVKSQSFDIDSLLLMIRLKGSSIYASVMVDNIKEIIKIIAPKEKRPRSHQNQK